MNNKIKKIRQVWRTGRDIRLRRIRIRIREEKIRYFNTEPI